MKLQIENTDGRIRNVGQPPWANQGNYPDTSIIEVDNNPPIPFYDYRYVNSEYILDVDDTHPVNVLQTNKDAATAEIDASVLKDKTPAQIRTYLTNRMTQGGWIELPADVRQDIGEWFIALTSWVAWK